MPKIPQRILMTADSVGGVWTYVIHLIRALEPYGVEVLLAVMGRELTPRQRQELIAMPNAIAAESVFKLEWMPEPWKDLDAAGRWLLDLENQYQPDLVHLNGYVHGTLPWSRPALIVGHSCVLSWWEAVKREPAPADWDQYAGAVRRGLHAANLVIAPSRAMARELNRLYGLPGLCRVIHNGIETEDYDTEKKNCVFAAGRVWDEAKNMGALTRVANRCPWPVRIAGDTRHPDGRVMHTAHVQLLGVLDSTAVQNEMASASVFVSPSLYEPFGLSVLEAALCGCTLLLNDIPTFRELWDGAAEFVDCRRSEDLLRALLGLIERPARRRMLAARARQRGLTYSAGRMAREYLNVYSDLLSSKAGAATAASTGIAK